MESRRSPKTSQQEFPPAVGSNKMDEGLVESWLEGHPEFFEDYFYRRASRRLVDNWLYRRARTTTVSAAAALVATAAAEAAQPMAAASSSLSTSTAGGGGDVGGSGSGCLGHAIRRSSSCTSTAIRKISSELSYLDRNQPSSPILSKFHDGSASFIVDHLQQQQCQQQQCQQQQQQHQHQQQPQSVGVPRSVSSDAAAAAGASWPSDLSLKAKMTEEDIIGELVRDIFYELDVSVLCHKILRNVCFLISADRCSLFLVESAPDGGGGGSGGGGGHSGQELVSSLFDVTVDSSLEAALANQSTIRIPLGQGIVGNVALTGLPTRIEDAYKDSRFNREVDRLTGYRTRSVLCMPVKDHRGDVIGVTQAVNKKSTAQCDCFTEKDEKTFERFLTFCGIGIRNAKLYKQSQLETKRNQVLLDLVRIIFEQQNDLDPLVRKIMHYMQVITHCRWCQILLIDDPSATEASVDNRSSEMKKCGLFDQVYELWTDDRSDGASGRFTVSEECRLLLNSQIARFVCDSGEPLNIPNASQDDRLTELERVSITALLCIPVKNAMSQVVGLCLLMNKPDGSPFSKGDQQLAEAFALFCGLGIHNTRMHEKADVAMKRQRVALEVLSYHAVAKLDDAVRLSKCLVPSARYLRVNDFAFTDIGLSDDDTLICAIKIFEDAGVFSAFKIDYVTFCRWLLSVRKNYRSVTYHNWRHALNVTQTMHAMLKTSRELRSLSRLDKMAMLVACLCHDLDHRGTDNKFQQLTLSPLAQLYSSSMLERHHFNQCIMLLSISGCDILSPLGQPQYERCIATIEKCILATDLERHFQIRKQIRQTIDEGQFDPTNPDHADMLHGLLMTAADLSAITKPWNVQYKTAQLVANEFYEQGDRERSELNLQPEDLKDREKQMRLPAMQVGFIDFVCLPVYTMVCELCTGLEPLRDGCQSNRKQWDSLGSSGSCCCGSGGGGGGGSGGSADE